MTTTSSPVVRGVAGRCLEVIRERTTKAPGLMAGGFVATWLADVTGFDDKAMPGVLGRLRLEGLIEETRPGLWRLTTLGLGGQKPEPPCAYAKQEPVSRPPQVDDRDAALRAIQALVNGSLSDRATRGAVAAICQAVLP